MNRTRTIALSIVVALQLAVLAGMLVLADLPLRIGKEIKIEVVPVDPRSMFRGNYALLNYSISRINRDLFPQLDTIGNGDIVYVSLKANPQALYELSSVAMEKPDTGVFLRGRVSSRHSQNQHKYIQVKYGIEAFFAPKKKAIALETQLTKGAIAILMVTDNGKSRLKDITAKTPL